jgi:maltoporin
VNSKGGKMEAFQAPCAGGKYILGNQVETKAQTVFTQKNWNTDPNGPSVMTSVNVYYRTKESASEFLIDPQPFLDEAYASMGNIVPGSDISIWGGKRENNLGSLGINNFTWYDLYGTGMGVENIKISNVGKLNISYIGYSPDYAYDKTGQPTNNNTTENGRLVKNNLNFMLKDVDVLKGKGTFWMNGGYIKGGIAVSTYATTGGYDLGMMYKLGDNDTNNQISFQYGFGACSSLASSVDSILASYPNQPYRFRVVDVASYKANNKLSIIVSGLYQYGDNGDSANSKQTWTSFGLRPVIGLTKYTAFELESGIDFVNDKASKTASGNQGVNDCLIKHTVAFRVAPDAGYATMPRFRVFATYAQWGDGFKGQIGGTTFKYDYNGLNCGVQCEYAW